MKTPPEEGLFLSKIDKKKIITFGYDQEMSYYILDLDLSADGVACDLCKVPIIEETPYYCKRDAIFLHKKCFAHPDYSSIHPGRLHSKQEHKDFPVHVSFLKKDFDDDS